MSYQDSFLYSLTRLKEFLLTDSPVLDEALEKAYSFNPWFTPEFSRMALRSIAREYLDEEKAADWMHSYGSSGRQPLRIAIIMAGNIPLAGFHDLLSVLASGHHALIKLSEKDAFLSKFITEQWIKIYPDLQERIRYTDRIEQYDAIIATGSNNSARYFEYYFRDKPRLLRKNRNGIAVLDGSESLGVLKDLSNDIFLYFGLGCRNVSKVFVPAGYRFDEWSEAMENWQHLSHHSKYRNNLDYNYAIYMINQVPHMNLGHIVLKEDTAIGSRIGCLHYEYYDDMESLRHELDGKRNDIQCLVSTDKMKGWDHIVPGQSQYPSLSQYADGLDTMKFLTSL